MSEYTAISVPEDVKQDLADDKPNDQSWGNYLTNLKANSAYSQDSPGVNTTLTQGDIDRLKNEISMVNDPASKWTRRSLSGVSMTLKRNSRSVSRRNYANDVQTPGA